jgi:3-oxoadipate CoA-transferase, alpha subunit
MSDWPHCWPPAACARCSAPSRARPTPGSSTASTYLLEYPIKGDYALIGAHIADAMGNLVYRKTARNFGPVMATAATTTIVQVDQVVEPGKLDPEAVVTPSIYVDRVVQVTARHYTVQGAR